MKLLRRIIKLILKLWKRLHRKESLIVIDALLDISLEFSKFTKTNLDNAALAYLSTYVRKKTKNLTESEVSRLSAIVTNETKGPLKNIKLGIDSKEGVMINSPIGDVKYNYHDGSIKWGTEIKL